MTLSLPCPSCAAEQPFDQPGCVDGHGADCPEWFCAVCGLAVWRGFSQRSTRYATPVAA